MNKILEQRLDALCRTGQQHTLAGGLKGLEKESLRLNQEGRIAQTPHPSGLGSALTHPYITTDYSEALLELITPPHETAEETLQFLDSVHMEIYRQLENELILASSMPCGIRNDQCIPIAEYGSSNVGMMKQIYRRGLGYRYGRAMQAIAGVHFNYSVPDNFWPVFQEQEQSRENCIKFRSDHYFAMIRNIQRFGWMLLYFFGASPAICKSFLHNRQEDTRQFEEFDPYTFYMPFATSLRMSSIGYQSNHQSGLNICTNSLKNYVASLTQAIQTPYPPFVEIGVKVDGEYRQLNANILQIENEYYSTIRPKQVTSSGERPTLALHRRGVRYVEFRALDLAMHNPIGVDLDTMRFLEVFALFCLLHESPDLSVDAKHRIKLNQLTTAFRGRAPDCELETRHGPIGLRQWAQQLCEDMRPIATLLDDCQPGTPYSAALEKQLSTLFEPDLTPSARILHEMGETGETFSAFAHRVSEQHESYFRKRQQDSTSAADFAELAARSMQEQRELEQRPQKPFDAYLQDYFSQQ